MFFALSRCQKPGRDVDQVRLLFPSPSHKNQFEVSVMYYKSISTSQIPILTISQNHKCFSVCACLWSSKNNRSFDTPVKGPPQGPRLHIDIPRVQLLIEDKEGIKQIGERKRERHKESFCACVHVCVHMYVCQCWSKLFVCQMCNEHWKASY